MEGIFETMTIQTLFEGCETELTSIYKPPGLSNDQFLLFCKMLETSKTNSVLLGDINIDYCKRENTDVFTHFCAAGLGPLIDRPTRITQNSQSCIDHVFSNIRGATGFVLDCDISDHLAVGLLPDIKSKFKHRRKEIDMPLQDKRSLSYLKQYLSIVDSKPVLNDNTPAAFEKFELIIREANDICCPTINFF
jgi:hypothetical protein